MRVGEVAVDAVLWRANIGAGVETAERAVQIVVAAVVADPVRRARRVGPAVEVGASVEVVAIVVGAN